MADIRIEEVAFDSELKPAAFEYFYRSNGATNVHRRFAVAIALGNTLAVLDENDKIVGLGVSGTHMLSSAPPETDFLEGLMEGLGRAKHALLVRLGKAEPLPPEPVLPYPGTMAEISLFAVDQEHQAAKVPLLVALLKPMVANRVEQVDIMHHSWPAELLRERTEASEGEFGARLHDESRTSDTHTLLNVATAYAAIQRPVLSEKGRPRGPAAAAAEL